MADLTDKQRVFIEEYLRCWNATEAARRAGYKGNNVTLGTVGHENLGKVYIRQEIDKRLAELHVIDRAQVANCPSRRGSCFVYLIKAENGLIKIGKTVDIRQRFRTLYTMCPVKLELVAFLETELADELEIRLHSEFSDKRVKGEWFALSSEDVRAIVQQHGFDEQTESVC